MIRSPCLPTARRRRTKRIRTPDAAWSSRGSPQSAMLPVPSSIRRVSISAEPRLAQSLNVPSGAQCFPTASDPTSRRNGSSHCLNAPSGAQCFPTRADLWPTTPRRSGLNTPSGAQCFPTRKQKHSRGILGGSQCTFWCSVLSDTTLTMLTGLPDGSQCTFWCSVLSDQNENSKGLPYMSQCTFWCSVLSDTTSSSLTSCCGSSLNAPSGAQCFPTKELSIPARALGTVSMHLLVLSAFRPKTEAGRSQSETGSQCTFWCSVLSDGRAWGPPLAWPVWSQCTFWCSVLSDPTIPTNRREMMCLNAPSGAQCFPTRCRPQRRTRPLWVSMHLLVLSAFRQRDLRSCGEGRLVSMHLLVLSAFRRPTLSQ